MAFIEAQVGKMRTLVAILLLTVAGCRAGEAPDITSKVFEKTNENGKVSFRMVTTYQGKEKVMMETFRPNAQGVLTISSRSYLAGGDLVMTESDEHNSGRLDTIAVYHPGTDDMDVFTRQADGSVKPVSAQTLKAYKKENAAVAEFIGQMFTNTNVSNAEITRRIEETQQKIRSAEGENSEQARKPATK